MNKKSVIHGLITLLLLAIIGYLLNNQRYLNNRLISLSSTNSTQKPFVTPTSVYVNGQKFENLIWKKYFSQNLGISFEYPENLKNFLGPETLILKESENGVNIIGGMASIFSAGKIITNDSVEGYWKKNDAKNNDGNGLMPAELTKTFFRNKLAYYFRNTEVQQVPTDYYLIPMDGYLLMIAFQKQTSLNQIIDTYCEKGVCDIYALYSGRDYEESFLKFNSLIMNRILSSIEFLR